MSAEQDRGYQRGYAAGRKRRRRDREAAEREAFRRRAFLAALPSALNGTWVKGESRIESAEARVALAWQMADLAMNGAR